MAEITTKIASIEHKSDPDSTKGNASPNAAGTTAVRRRRKSLDLLGVTPTQMREWDIPHNHDSGEASVGLRWVRNKDCNVHKDAPEDRVSAVQYELDGAEPVRVNGKVITRHDVLLMRYPKEYDKMAQKEIDTEATRIAEGLRPGAEGSLESHEEFDAHGQTVREMSKAEMKAHLARMHDYHMNSGMIGPTAHMSMSDAIRISGGPEAAAKEEERFRRGSAHREMGQDEWAQMFTDQAPTSRAVRSFHGMGDSGIGKSTKDKVALNSAAGRRAAALATPAERR